MTSIFVINLSKHVILIKTRASAAYIYNEARHSVPGLYPLGKFEFSLMITQCYT